MRSRRDPLSAWARSGAMALTGWPQRPPLGPPSGFVERLDAIGERLAHRAGGLGRDPGIDPLALLTERAAIAGLSRGGQVSCGGGTRLLRGRDGWFALSLTRADDVALVAAWLVLDAPVPASATGLADRATWTTVEAAVADRAVADLEARAVLLGLPLGVLPEVRPTPTAPASAFGDLPVGACSLGDAPARPLTDLVVADLSSLWAGPLCGRILADAGATVVKVESASRPDGARRGPPAFFDLMNAGKGSVCIDLRASEGVPALTGLLRRADVVIEGSRPRALEQLGLDAAALVAEGPQVWVSITGHGREGTAAQRVAFGDDAAVAGGLVAWSDGQPCFCADAAGDPCSGLVAAAATLDALAAGGRWLIDVPMARVAAHLAGPTLPVSGEVVHPPTRPASRGQARALGADDAAYC